MGGSPRRLGDGRRTLVELAYATSLLALYITILHPFLFNQDIHGWGTDIYGHLYKIWKVMNSGYVEWTKDWHAGFPLFRFYPPLSYLIAAGIGRIFNSDIIGFKITVLLSMIIGAYGTRFLLKELEIDERIRCFVSVLYPIYPFFINNTIPEGNFPRYVALMFLPLFVLAFFYIFKYKDRRKLILSSIFISMLILTHHNTSFVAVLLVIGLLPYFFITKKVLFRELLKNIITVGLLSLLLTSFWTIPFIFEIRYSEFIDELKITYHYEMWSVDLKRVLNFDFEYVYYFGFLFFVIGIFGCITILFGENLEKRILGFNLLFVVFLFTLLASGIYGPVPELNLISPLSKVLPYRYLDGLGLITIIGTSKLLDFLFNNLLFNMKRDSIKENKKQIVTTIFVCSLIISLIIMDILFSSSKLSLPYISENIKNKLFPEYLDTLKVISTNISLSDANIYQFLTDISLGGMMAYYPITFGVSSLSGWYRQGIQKILIRSFSPSHLLGLENLSDYFFGFVESLLITQNVKCIIARKDIKEYLNASKYLELLKFEKIYESNHHSLWCWNKNSFVTPKHYQLIREYRIGRLFALVGNPLITEYFNISADRYQSLDDLAKVENIFAYKIIFLYDYGDYNDRSVWVKLEEFVRRGGVLVIDTFRSKDMGSRIFNVSSRVVKVERRHLSSEVYDVTRFDEFSKGFDWYATVYCGDLKPIIEYVVRDSVRNEECAAVGYKAVGYGYVFFVGLNLPDHISYTGNEYEEFVLRDIVERFVPLFPDIIEYRVLEYGDGRMRFIVSSKYDAWLLIAQPYFPGWRAKLNGVEIPVYEDQLYGLIELYVPEGTWILELEFVDRWLWLKYVSFFTLVAVVVVLLHPTARDVLRRLRSLAALLSSSPGV